MRRKTGSSSKKNKKQNNKKLDADQLIASAEAFMASLDVERAAQLYSQAKAQVTDVPKRIQILEKLGECKISLGDQEEARTDFQEAIGLLEQSPHDTLAYHETRSNLYLYAGQLCMEQDALRAYKQGIQSLEACLGMTMDDETEKVFRQKMSGAYCTIAELYLTDLCYEDNAESECESYLEKALQIKDLDGEPLVDALQTMASLRLSQKSRQLEAVPFILRAYDKMKVGSEALAALVGLADDASEKMGEEAVELKEVDAANNLPEFEFRCQTAKLLLECAAVLKESSAPPVSLQPNSQEDQCLSAAISVLGSLLAQNDEVIEIWYLTGCAVAAKSLSDSARFYFDKAMQMLQDTKKELEQEAKFADQQELEELQEQLEENRVQIEDVQAKLSELGEEEEETMEEG